MTEHKPELPDPKTMSHAAILKEIREILARHKERVCPSDAKSN